jgi:hypothetical protein
MYAVRASGGASWMATIAQRLLRPINCAASGRIPTTV